MGYWPSGWSLLRIKLVQYENVRQIRLRSKLPFVLQAGDEIGLGQKPRGPARQLRRSHWRHSRPPRAARIPAANCSRCQPQGFRRHGRLNGGGQTKMPQHAQQRMLRRVVSVERRRVGRTDDMWVGVRIPCGHVEECHPPRRKANGQASIGSAKIFALMIARIGAEGRHQWERDEATASRSAPRLFGPIGNAVVCIEPRGEQQVGQFTRGCDRSRCGQARPVFEPTAVFAGSVSGGKQLRKQVAVALLEIDEVDADLCSQSRGGARTDLRSASNRRPTSNGYESSTRTARDSCRRRAGRAGDRASPAVGRGTRNGRNASFADRRASRRRCRTRRDALCGNRPASPRSPPPSPHAARAAADWRDPRR